MRKQIILFITLLLLFLLACLIGCGGGGGTSSGTVPVIVVTATPDSVVNNINRGYLREDYTVDWNATSTSNSGVAIFEGLSSGQSYIINSSLGTTLSNIVTQVGMLSTYYIYRNPGWSSNSYSGYTELSGDVLETDKVTPIKNCSVSIISETTGQTFNTTTNSQGNFSFSGSFPLGYYTMIYSANNYKTWGIYHYPFRTDSLKFHMNLIKNEQWNSYAGSTHPYDANKGYIFVTVMESEANQTVISGVSMSIQSNQPSAPTVTNTPVIINPTAIPSTPTPEVKFTSTPTPTYTPTKTPTPGTITVYSSTTANHTHNITISASDLNSPPSSGKTYISNTTDGHTHAITLTQAQLVDINNGNTVTVISSNNNGHTHTWTIINPNSSAPTPTATPASHIPVTVQ